MTGILGKRQERREKPARRDSPAPGPEVEMPEEPTQALRFGKARIARSTTLREDYVELIADLHACDGEARVTDLAKRLGVTHPTALKIIARLKREGLVTARPYRGLFLTDIGHELAARLHARHRLVVDLLIAVGVPAEAAESDAEGIEHHVSELTLKAFARFVADRSSTKAALEAGANSPAPKARSRRGARHSEG
jgi:DtxR family transcriptional regulator, manganese transport regulator